MKVRKNKMKLMSRILSFVLIVTLLNTPTYGATTLSTDELLNYYADKVISLEHKDMFIELLRVVQSVDNAQSLMVAYNNAFNSLSGGQQDQLNSMSYILNSMADIKEYLFGAGFNVDTFADYIGLGTDGTVKRDLLIEMFKSHEQAIVKSLGSLNQETIDAGFARTNKLFDLLKDIKVAKSLQIAQLFQVSAISAADMSLLNDQVDVMILFLGLKNKSIVADTTSIKAGMNQFVSYYNLLSSTNRTTLFNYFDTYGLMRVGSTSTGNTGGSPGGTVPPAPAGGIVGGTTPTIIDEEILTEEIPEGINVFGDIGNVQWAWTAISQLYSADVIKGKTAGQFAPQSNVTRAEFTSLLARMFDISTLTPLKDVELVFSDVNMNHWFYKDVMSVYEAGYVKGAGNGKFNANATISREEIATILERILAEKGIKSSEDNYLTLLDQFADASTVSEWARKGSALLFEKGIITGTVENKVKFYNFKKYASRAEVAVMLYRIAGIVKTKVINLEQLQ